MRWQLAACLALALCAGASAQVFEHRGWKAYEVADDDEHGCRMAKRAREDVHVVAYANFYEGFGIGVVKGSWNLPTGRTVPGMVTFDGVHRHVLEGGVENPQLVMFHTGGEGGGLPAQFAESRTVEIAVEGVRVVSDLGGSSRALEMLYKCAERFDTRSDRTLSVASASSSASGAADLSFLRQGADFLPLRERLLDAGWQAIFSRVTNSSDANMQRRHGLPELESCSGTGMGFCLLSYRDARGNRLSVTTAGSDDFVLHGWSINRE